MFECLLTPLRRCRACARRLAVLELASTPGTRGCALEWKRRRALPVLRLNRHGGSQETHGVGLGAAGVPGRSAVENRLGGVRATAAPPDTHTLDLKSSKRTG